MLTNFTFSHLRLTLTAKEPVVLPEVNKGNNLRGAFGICFKRLVCLAPQDCRERCRHKEICPYGKIFEPSPLAGSERLRANQDIPRPFVIRPPLTRQTRFERDAPIEFELILFGSAIEFFPYFGATFKFLGDDGLGKTRGRVDLDSVVALGWDGDEKRVYSSHDNLFRVLSGRTRLNHLLRNGNERAPDRLTLEFLTPTVIKSESELVREPEFHHILKRLRDRINALAYFYCGETLDTDYRALGEAAKNIRTVSSELHWENRFRRSWRTGQYHPMGGFTGRITFEGDFTPFWPLLVLGQYTHVGKYAVWGNGWYRILDDLKQGIVQMSGS